MNSLWMDLRYAVRMLLKNPGFACVALVTLGLGIGANTAIFSVINSVLLRPLPFRDPGQLARLFSTRGAENRYPVSGEDYFDWETMNHAFDATTLYTGPQNYNASGAGEPETVSVCRTQANFFSLLGVSPQIGRGFVQGEDSRGAAHVAVLSYGFWQRHLGGSADALGKTINLDFEKYTVVGVMPRGFNYPEGIDAWVPLQMTLEITGRRGNYSFRTLARMADNMQDTSLQTGLLGSFAALGVILAAVGIYGVMAYLVMQWRREIGIRMALGAQRVDVVQMVIGRGAKLALAGVVGGVAGALGLTQLMTKELFGVRASDPLTFAGVSVFLVAVALAACYLPARRAAKVDPMVALRYE